MIGTVLDQRYQVLKKLGEGAMGEVYLVEHLHLGRKEALKILRPEIAEEPKFLSRFRREARATNRLSHPGIVSVHDFGKLADGRFFLAMEFAEGERLDALLKRVGPLPIPRALHILAQIADAVDHAHTAGVVHRDLKPENLILVERRGQADLVKVLDFGLAKIIVPEYRETINVSQQNQVFGTPAYMAPEQIRVQGIEPRCDLYAIGCIAFELLTGATPFVGGALQLFEAHIKRVPERVSSRRDGISPELDAIVARCLEKEAPRRFPTGKELAAAFKMVPGFPQPKSGSGRRSWANVPAPVWADDGQTEVRRTATPAVAPGGAGGFEDTVQEGSASAEEARRALRAAVFAAAESLLDLDRNDYRLVLEMANLQELEGDLQRSDEEVAALEAKQADLEQGAREREGALRFAIGDLRFERSQALGRGEVPSRDLDFQIDQLEKRLRRVMGEVVLEQGLTDERGIALAAQRAGIEERIDASFLTMERVIDELGPKFLTDETVATRVAYLNGTRQLIKSFGHRKR